MHLGLLRLAPLFPILASAAVGQIHDDPDVSPSPFAGSGAHTLRMTHTDDGRIVAAWAVDDAGNTPGTDEIAIGVSADGGCSWSLLWDARSNEHHDNRVADLAIAVEPVRGAGAQADPRVYVVVEWHTIDWKTGHRQGRFLTCYDGPLERPWPGHQLSGRHVHGQFAHEVKLHGYETTTPSIALPLYRDGTDWQPMVVIAYRWLDYTGPGVYLATPYRGKRGRVVNGREVFGEHLSADLETPTITADPVGRVFGFAARDRTSGDVVVEQIETRIFRTGRYRPFASDRFLGGYYDPQIAMEGASLVLTALGRYTGSGLFREMVWFRNRHGVGWSRASLLHPAAVGPGAVTLNEGRMFVAAHCRIDNRGTLIRLHGFQVGTQSAFPTVDVVTVGDTLLHGRASVAYVGRAEPAAYGAADGDGHLFRSASDRVVVDPAR